MAETMTSTTTTTSILQWCLLTKEGEKLIQGKALKGLQKPSYSWLYYFPSLLVPITLPFVIIISFIRRIIQTKTPGLLEVFGFFKNDANLVQRASSRTAWTVAITRCLITECQLADDYLANTFLPFEIVLWTKLLSYLVIAKGIQSFGSITFLSARCLFFDRIIINSQPKQVVILGAGFDTRSYRLGSNDDCIYFEIDIETTQQIKKEFIENDKQFKGKKQPQFLQVNFSKEKWSDKLKKHPLFNPKEPRTVFIWEGVSYYLTWDEVKDTLTQIKENFPSSLLALDFLEDVWTENNIYKQDERQHAKNGPKLASRVGEGWKWGLQDGETAVTIFEPLGFEILAHLGPEACSKQFLTIEEGFVTPISEICHLALLKA